MASKRVPTFKEFWQAYPRKRGKDKAEKVWKGMGPEARQLAFAALPAYIDDYQRNNVTFMYPQGWLNQKRWRDYVEDETESKAPVQGSSTSEAAKPSARFFASKANKFERKVQGDSGTEMELFSQPEPQPADTAAPSLADMETW